MFSPEPGSDSILSASQQNLAQKRLDEMRSLTGPLWRCHHSHCVSVCLQHFLMEKFLLSVQHLYIINYTHIFLLAEFPELFLDLLPELYLILIGF